jgi:23S rRNA (adenine2503-C2)-methyltransferase
MLPEEVETFVVSLGEKSYRSRQLLQWVYRHGARQYEEMTTLSKVLRERLAERAPLSDLNESNRLESTDGSVKVAFRTRDGLLIESVLISRGRHRTACLSTQAGCALKCAFCATGRSGFERNLNSEEIVDQALELARVSGEFIPPTHIVLMGMGEPLLNAEAVFRAVRILTHPMAFALSPGRITLSTVGIIDGLKKLASADLKVNVALSLNAPTEDLRRRLMPIARANPLDELLGVFSKVPASRRSPRTLEYVLLHGVNDSPAHATALSGIARRTSSKVNLIPFNEVDGIEFKAPPEPVIEGFIRVLARDGVAVTVRRSKGSGIGAACGQLASVRSRS